MTAEERQDAHKNLMSYSDDYSIDIPPRYTSIRDYRATLGHKANHQFEGKDNVGFDFLTTPRFGNTRCLRAKRLIKRGEEIFLNYSYNMSNDPPEWYVRFYESIYG